MNNASMPLLPMEHNSSNGSVTDSVTGATVLLIVNAACNLLSLLLLLPYIPVLRAAWKLPKSDMLPWIFVNLFLIAITTSVRGNLRFARLASFIRLGQNGWMLSIDTFCSTLQMSLSLSQTSNNILPLVFALIEVVSLYRPGLASKQWLFNCVGSVGIWVVSLGLGVPFLTDTYIETGTLACRESENEADLNYEYLAHGCRKLFFALSAYAVFLLYMTLSGQNKWKPGHRLGIETMICALSLYSIQETAVATVMVISPTLFGTLRHIAFGSLALADLTLSLSGVIIFCRYKKAQSIAKAMLLCCWRKRRVQPTD